MAHRRHRRKKRAAHIVARPRAAASIVARPIHSHIKHTGKGNKPQQDQGDSGGGGEGGGQQEEAPQEEAPQQEEQSQEKAPQEEEQAAAPQQTAPQQEEGDDDAPPQTTTPDDAADEDEAPPTVSGDISIPLTSSHYFNGKVRTSAISITPQGCSYLHCASRPRAAFGVDGTAGIHHVTLRRMAMVDKQKRAAEHMVRRAREGDQNAMALMVLVRDNAAKGQEVAKRSLGFMQRYVSANPVTRLSSKTKGASFGAELSIAPDGRTCIALANGPPLTSHRIRRAVSAFGADAPILVKSIREWQQPNLKATAYASEKHKQIIKLGKTLGMAHAIQMIRKGAPISVYSKAAAWELGE